MEAGQSTVKLCAGTQNDVCTMEVGGQSTTNTALRIRKAFQCGSLALRGEALLVLTHLHKGRI